MNVFFLYKQNVEIMDEMDNAENMRVLARNLWIKRARALGIEEEHAGSSTADPTPPPDKPVR